MKGKFLKETKFFKRNKFTRIMALILAMIMMSAPFFAHAGLKGDSKAEEAETKKNYTMTGITLTTDIKADKAKIIYKNGKYMIGYNNGAMDVEIPPKTGKTYNFDPNYVSLKITKSSVINNINFGTIVDDNTLVSGKKLSASFGDSIYYSVGYGGEKIELTDSSEILVTKESITITPDIYFWFKAVITDDNTPSGTYETEYQAVYSLKFR